MLIINEKPPDNRRFNCIVGLNSASSDTVSRAHLGAGATAGAGVGVNDANITGLADSVYGAFGFTSATVDAFFLIDNVSHALPPNV